MGVVGGGTMCVAKNVLTQTQNWQIVGIKISRSVSSGQLYGPEGKPDVLLGLIAKAPRASHMIRN